jgi:hypothetical protein
MPITTAPNALANLDLDVLSGKPKNDALPLRPRLHADMVDIEAIEAFR